MYIFHFKPSKFDFKHKRFYQRVCKGTTLSCVSDVWSCHTSTDMSAHRISLSNIYVPIKVKPGGHIQGTDIHPSDHTCDSDKSNSFQHHSDITNGRNIDPLTTRKQEWSLQEGILAVKVHGRVGILTEKYFLSEFLGSA